MSSFCRHNQSKKKGTVLIVGVNGQDGSYLAKHLFNESWNVLGIGRQKSARADVASLLSSYIQIDITETLSFQRALERTLPDLIFYAAAVHGPAGYRYEDVWYSAHQVNTLGLQAILEHARKSKGKVKIIYLSSAKVFGDLSGKEIVEDCSKFNSCIYSITKNTSASLISYYRSEHGVDASVIWLFNHESEWRANEFFVKKIVVAVKNCLVDRNHRIEVKTLDFWCDWGLADEFMLLLAKHCRSLGLEDYIVATGNTVWARDVVSEFFVINGLDIDRHIKVRDLTIEKSNNFWAVNINKFKTKTHDFPKVTGIDVFIKILANL